MRYTTAIRSLYRHVVCNGPVPCKAYRVGNQLGAWLYSDLLSIVYQAFNTRAKRYRKVPKFLDARKLCCNLPKIKKMEPNLRVFRQKDANGIANSEDTDQTAPLGAVNLGLHCLPRPICPKT